MELIKDEEEFVPSEKCAQLLSLDECILLDLFRSPDSGRFLRLTSNNEFLTDNDLKYPIIQQSPVLYPLRLLNVMSDNEIPLEYYDDPLIQYYLLSQIKQSGEINAQLDSSPARKHQKRFSNFIEGIEGLVLDVGSDRPSYSSKLFSEKVKYLGLDPYAGSGEYRTIGIGEILPFQNDKFDAVTFNTSLDHILDYHTAIEEAYRVTKIGGSIIIASYAWISSATLLTDNVHFHHFREYEIVGSIETYFEIEQIKRYKDPKNDKHRYGLYISATKKI